MWLSALQQCPFMLEFSKVLNYILFNPPNQLGWQASRPDLQMEQNEAQRHGYSPEVTR